MYNCTRRAGAPATSTVFGQPRALIRDDATFTHITYIHIPIQTPSFRIYCTFVQFPRECAARSLSLSLSLFLLSVRDALAKVVVERLVRIDLVGMIRAACALCISCSLHALTRARSGWCTHSLAQQRAHVHAKHVRSTFAMLNALHIHTYTHQHTLTQRSPVADKIAGRR